MKRIILVALLSGLLIGSWVSSVYAQEKPGDTQRAGEVIRDDDLLAMKAGVLPHTTVNASKLDSTQLAVIGRVFGVPPTRQRV